jgi:hypothetical protein
MLMDLQLEKIHNNAVDFIIIHAIIIVSAERKLRAKEDKGR